MTRRRAAALMLAVVIAFAACSKTEAPSVSALAGPTGAAPVAGTFELRPDTLAQVRGAGLTMLPTEELALHYHTHLDVIVASQAVVVPAYIGITNDAISPLHTHDTTGMVHVEAADVNARGTFRLDQVFAEWGVAFTSTCIATYCTDATNELRVYTDGKRADDPTRVPLVEGQEVAVWYGPKLQTNPPRANHVGPGGGEPVARKTLRQVGGRGTVGEPHDLVGTDRCGRARGIAGHHPS